MNPVQRTRNTKNVESSIVKYAMLDSIPTGMLGLGLYGKFAANGDAFLPFLNDSTNVSLLIILGAVGMFLCTFKIVSLVMRRAKTKKII